MIEDTRECWLRHFSQEQQSLLPSFSSFSLFLSLSFMVSGRRVCVRVLQMHFSFSYTGSIARSTTRTPATTSKPDDRGGGSRSNFLSKSFLVRITDKGTRAVSAFSFFCEILSCVCVYLLSLCHRESDLVFLFVFWILRTRQRLLAVTSVVSHSLITPASVGSLLPTLLSSYLAT